MRRAINAPERLHSVVIGFALTAGARVFLEPWAEDKTQFSTVSLCLFVALLFTIVPFYHGANRHLDAVHLYSGRPLDPHALLVDYSLLFVEGVLFLALGLSVQSLDHFVFFGFVLMTVDIAWGYITRRLLATRGIDARHITPWLSLNW